MRFVTLYSPYKTWTLFQVTLLLDANVHEWGERSRLTPKWIKNLIHQLVRVTWKAWALTFTHLKCRKIWPKTQQRFPSTHTLKHAVSFMKPVRKRQESMNVSHIFFLSYLSCFFIPLSETKCQYLSSLNDVIHANTCSLSLLMLDILQPLYRVIKNTVRFFWPSGFSA